LAHRGLAPAKYFANLTANFARFGES
jgi:hypothetical protein